MAQDTGQRGEVGIESLSWRDADQQLLEEELLAGQEQLEAASGGPGDWAERTGQWLGEHRRGVALVALGAVLVAVGFATAARARG